jgi:hypothetical protein
MRRKQQPVRAKAIAVKPRRRQSAQSVKDLRRVARISKQPRQRRQRRDEAPEVPTYEPPNENTDLTSVVVDPEAARNPRSALAREIAAEAKGDDHVEYLKSKRGAIGTGVVHEVNPYDLYLKPGWNKRNFETERRKLKIDELARSIADVGVREILQGYIEDNKVYISSGWNRLLATYRAIETYEAPVRAIPVRVGRQGENDADRLLSQIINNQADPPLPFEQGLICKGLRDYGWTVEDIAKKIGKSTTSVKALIELQELPPEVQALVDANVVSAYMATLEYRKYGGNGARTIKALHRAIANAQRVGAKRVMPKHADDAADPPPAIQRRKRRSGRPNTDDRRNSVSALVEANRQGEIIERNVKEEYVLVRYSLSVYDTIAVIAEIPDENEADDEIVDDADPELQT